MDTKQFREFMDTFTRLTEAIEYIASVVQDEFDGQPAQQHQADDDMEDDELEGEALFVFKRDFSN